MGNSKVMLLGAVTVIIGMYALKIKEADRTVATIGGYRAYEYQASELAKAGIDLAVNELSATSSLLSVSRTKKLLGGTVAYTISVVDWDKQKVTSTATVNGQTRTLIAYLQKAGSGTVVEGRKKKKWSRWATTKIYVKPYQVNWKTGGSTAI
ncbi:MAG TPA: hypothetical protein VNL36_00980 [Bacteroidota bacterium]|nr:hypothetical protein [Bacteroidota bacterium]